MATFVQLVERLRVEAALPIPTITTLVGANDEVQRLANWVSDANADIERMDREWKWMRAQALAPITAGGGMRYTPAQCGITTGGHRRWRRQQPPLGGQQGYTVRAFEASNPANEWRVHELERDVFTQRFLVGQHQTGSPQYWAEADNGDLLIGPTPDRNYTVRADYVRAVQTLAADAETPGMPADFHSAVMWYALFTYAVDDASPEQITRARLHYNRLESALLRDQGVRITARMDALSTGAGFR